ncbi:flagellar hook-basal body protein [Amphibacillus indicireducens]|uniref:Flagellar hook-basal body complex protein FlhP n=1 Tax=Amphibacillus indicireducens TaxID=1076330 RepID=A0ABP7VLD8_9BACI
MSRMNIQAAVTMGQLQNKLDLISHNVANLNTSGYKSQSANFSSLIYQNIDNLRDQAANAPGRQTPHGIRLGSGARIGHTNINLSAGALNVTNRGLDIALLRDNHLLQIEVTENGNTETRYTRDGTLYLQPIDGGQLMLTTSDGHPVIGQTGGAIIFDENIEDIRINEIGQIVTRRGGTEFVEDGLALVEAVRPQFLEPAGKNLFRLPDLTEAAYVAEDIVTAVDQFDNEIQSGTLEQSNVDLATQMAELLQTQRAYQYNARTITMHDQMRGLINQLR